MDAAELIDNFFNGREPKVIRVKLTAAQIEKLLKGKILDFKAGKHTVTISQK